MSENMRILAIDTSTSQLSVAVLEGSKVLGVRNRDSLGSHTRWLVPTIDELLDALSIKLEHVTGLAISIGPGSFTGLRAGLASVAGIRLALDIPLVAVPTLEAMAWNIRDAPMLLCPMLRARANELYWACFRWRDGKLLRVIDDQVGLITDIVQALEEPTLGFGEGWTKNQEVFLDQSNFLRAAPCNAHKANAGSVGLASIARIKSGDITQVGHTPCYILQSYAETTKERRSSEERVEC